jgi:hypothetical protein
MADPRIRASQFAQTPESDSLVYLSRLSQRHANAVGKGRRYLAATLVYQGQSNGDDLEQSYIWKASKTIQEPSRCAIG